MKPIILSDIGFTLLDRDDNLNVPVIKALYDFK